MADAPIPMFTFDAEYSRAEISARLGGSRVSCLPTDRGVVVAVCVTRDFNPDAPEVILCGTGARTGPASERFAQHRQPLPVFIKRNVNRWVYQGRFVVTETLTHGDRFERFIAGSGRSVASVSNVVLLKRAP